MKALLVGVKQTASDAVQLAGTAAIIIGMLGVAALFLIPVGHGIWNYWHQVIVAWQPAQQNNGTQNPLLNKGAVKR